jgi:ABC-type branched-subunit amino acid transport system substrate-binding protein
MPFVGLDILLDGPGAVTGSFVQVAGASRNAYAVFPAGTDPVLGPEVASGYQRAYGHAPGNFVLTADACATIILDALARIDASSVGGPAAWRHAIRAEVTAPGREYATAVGRIHFDANGDVQPRRLSVYRVDATARDWAFWQLIELGADD